MDIRNILLRTTVLMVVLSFSASLSANVSRVQDKPNVDLKTLKQDNQNKTTSANEVYDGSIKVHIVEPVSRWFDKGGTRYDNAHLSYSIDAPLNIPDGTIWDTTVIWDGAAHGFSDVTPENIGSIVAVFNPTGELADADPGGGYWFIANYVDASAMATPGFPGKNRTASGFTHTVYVEEGTATW